MKKKKVIFFILCFAIVALLTTSIPVLAVTEAEVQEYVNENGKEAATGNVFIWFLCAIAFLKVSQKIDSFMGALGISVGHTGGSMLTEAMIAARGISGIKQGLGGSGGGGRGSGSSGGFMAGGLAGAVGRKFSAGAANAATGKDGGGIIGKMGGMAYEASVKNGGKLANDTIGAVAKGSISEQGTISGDKAADALKSYMGINAESNSQVNSSVNGGAVSKSVDNSSSFGSSGTPSSPAGGSIPMDAAGGEIPPMPSDSIEGIPDVSPGLGGMDSAESIVESVGGTGLDAEIGMETAGIPLSPDAVADIPSSPEMAAGAVIASELADIESGDTSGAPIPQTGSIPVSPADAGAQPTTEANPVSSAPRFENVEIGGGRITGVETTPAHPQGREFAMYHSEQYLAPQSRYEMVKMIDGSKWYKQYAMPSVEKTPHMGTKGKVEYTEKIVDKVPPMPKRKDRV